MARTAAPERIDLPFPHCTLEPPPGADEAAGPVAGSPERSFENAKDELLALVCHAIGRIEHADEAQAALRELWAVLLEVKAIVARDPGMRMAADDLLAAATVLAAGEGAGPGVVDARRWRLLREAETRLRSRLRSAEPSDKARLSGLN